MDTRKELRLDEKSTTLAIEGKVECKGAELLPCSTILSRPLSPPPHRIYEGSVEDIS